MTKDSLLRFIKRIMEKGSQEKSGIALYQLREILDQQQADKDMIILIDNVLMSVPEVKETAKKKDSLTEEDLKIAFNRALERRRREAELSRQGRC